MLDLHVYRIYIFHSLYLKYIFLLLAVFYNKKKEFIYLCYVFQYCINIHVGRKRYMLLKLEILKSTQLAFVDKRYLVYTEFILV
jgi:hypothetical protein